MPYFITDESSDCDGWATVKADGEVMGCHSTKQASIDQMVALSIAEGIEPGGERVERVPQFIRNAAERGLELRREGFGGDGLTDQTIREARAMARGQMSDDKAKRANAWAARHAVDLEAPKNRNTNDPEWPGAGAVAHYLWGINPLNPGPARRWLERQAEKMTEQRQSEDVRAPVGGADKYTTKAEALARAAQLGCEGTHSMDEDGQTIYMPCSTHAAYDAAKGGTSGGYDRTSSESRGIGLPEHYRPATSPDVPEGRACGNCFFFNENDVAPDGRARCMKWGEYVQGGYVCNKWQANERATDMSSVEFRTFGADVTEIRASEVGDGMTFGGYAWRYNAPSLPLGHGFTERIAEGAFTRSLKSRVDIRAYVNHNDELLLGSTRAKTLRIEDRSDGGYVEIDLPNTSTGNDIRVLVERGDIQGMSFGFSTVKDSWSEDGAERTLLAAKIHEVSVVTGVPAYPQTTASVRKLMPLASRTSTDVDELSEAMAALQSGELSADQASLLRTVVDKVAASGEPAATVPTSILAAKLTLAEKALGL